MTSLSNHDMLDSIDWNVVTPMPAVHDSAEELDVDLGWLHKPSPVALSLADAIGADGGLSIDIDEVPRRPAAAFAYDHEYNYDYDYDYDLHFAALEPTESVHAVLLYDDSAVWLREMVRFVADGIRAGELVFLVLTADVEQSLRAALPAELLAVAERTGNLVISDAHAVLDVVITDGMLNHTAFTEQVVPSIQKLFAERGAFRTSGQAVTLLWESGNVPAALALEHRWNELQKTIPFTMLCAYPRTLVADGSDDFQLVSACHSEVHVHSQ